MAPMTLPPGFRFHPTDEELVAYYLDRKISGRTIELEIIPEVDLYKCEPWDLPDKSFLPSKDMEWYFYSPRDRKYPNGSRTNRATRGGYWKATGKDRAVQSNKRAVGMKKTLVYYRGRAPHGIRTNWVMHEYRLLSASASSSTTLKDSYALCRVFKKTIQIPKSKEDEEEAIGNAEWIWEEQLQGEDTNTSGIEICNGKEGEDHDYSKFAASDTSSSDLTQSIVDDLNLQAPFASDEANSSWADFYSLGAHHFSSNLILQDEQTPAFPSLHYQFPYPPLELEDFPQINIGETKAEINDECMMYDVKYRDYANVSLEEIFSLCSSQDNSIIPLSMHH